LLAIIIIMLFRSSLVLFLASQYYVGTANGQLMGCVDMGIDSADSCSTACQEAGSSEGQYPTPTRWMTDENGIVLKSTAGCVCSNPDSSLCEDYKEVFDPSTAIDCEEEGITSCDASIQVACNTLCGEKLEFDDPPNYGSASLCEFDPTTKISCYCSAGAGVNFDGCIPTEISEAPSEAPSDSPSSAVSKGSAALIIAVSGAVVPAAMMLLW
jgi:hypothetical protein